jgi:hypothetical protein
MADRILSYAEFWPYNLGQQARSTTRALHYFGTSLSLMCLVAALYGQEWWFLLAAVVTGYFFAWIAHFFVEKNRPATFTYPAWSLVSDFRMYGFWLTGRLGEELEGAGVAARA